MERVMETFMVSPAMSAASQFREKINRYVPPRHPYPRLPTFQALFRSNLGLGLERRIFPPSLSVDEKILTRALMTNKWVEIFCMSW